MGTKTRAKTRKKSGKADDRAGTKQKFVKLAYFLCILPSLQFLHQV